MTEQITLTNDHGVFVVDPKVLSRAVSVYGAASTHFVRRQAAGAAGYPETSRYGVTTALDDCTLIEALIIWVESGNHTF